MGSSGKVMQLRVGINVTGPEYVLGDLRLSADSKGGRVFYSLGPSSTRIPSVVLSIFSRVWNGLPGEISRTEIDDKAGLKKKSMLNRYLRRRLPAQAETCL